MAEIHELIEESANRLTQDSGFMTWRESHSVSAGDLVLVNNSFVFRDVKTTKSESYLAFRAEEGEPVTLAPVIANGIRMNSDFKRFSASSSLPSINDLHTTVEAQVKRLGELVFLLIGEVDDSIVTSVGIDASGYREVVWDPTISELVHVEDDRIVVKSTDDEEVIWQATEDHFRKGGEDPPDALRGALGVALDKLQDQAAARVCIPSAGTVASEGITDSILTVLGEQRKEYAQAVATIRHADESGRRATNDVLRLAYNFSSDAAGYLRLIVSVCDLKPVVLWATIAEHYALSQAFNRLPWARSNRKASLKSYQQAIADARNSAFHNLFPFRKTLHVGLSDGALGEPELRIFSEHAKKKENDLIYRDKELVDVLVGFTRARERRVPIAFWEKNLEVMDTTMKLFEATNAFLKRAAIEREV